MKKIILFLFLFGVFTQASFGATTIDVSKLKASQALTTGEYIITGVNSGSDIANAVLYVEKGNTVSITLDNVNFKTSNTDTVTTFISALAGSNVNVTLKGTNVFDASAISGVTKQVSAALSFSGAGVFNISQDVSGGSITTRVGSKANTSLVTIYYAPSSKGVLNINGGLFRNETVVNANTTSARLLHVKGNAGTLNITGGVFENTFTSPSKSHKGSLIFSNSGGNGPIINIKGGVFKADRNFVLYSQSGKKGTFCISAGTFTREDKGQLFSAEGIAGNQIEIAAGASITDDKNNTSKIGGGSNKVLTADEMATYLSALTVK